MTKEKFVCYFCESEKAMPPVGIAFGSHGCDYSFCRKCLKDMTADELIRVIAINQNLSYPLKKSI